MSTSARWLLIVAAFLTFFDRALLPPLLPVVADDLGAPVESIGHALIAYVVAYAAAQLLWSVVSSRVGRIRVLGISSTLAVIGNVVSALAVDPGMLSIGRTIAGAAFAATVPAVLTYFGDTLAMKERAVATANLAAALSLGMTVGTLGASFAGEWVHWRVAFAAAALVSAVLAGLLFLVPEHVRTVPQRFFPALARIARNRWALAVLALTALEGALLVGILNYLPVGLQLEGVSVVVAGLATAAFGVSVIVWSQLMKLLLRVWPSWSLLLVGGLGAVLAYALLGWTITVVTVGIAAVLLGFSWALAHTQMQTWMTDAAFNARPVGMSLFAIALFGGGSIGTAIGNAAVPSQAFPMLFTSSAVAAAVFAIGASITRARYRVREQ